MSSADKSLGQVAHEARGVLHAGSMAFAGPIQWDALPKWQRDETERMAQAVAATVREQCTAACESERGDEPTNEWARGFRYGVSCCIAAIRSIKP